jgi:predicted nucleotide-binding protein
VPDPQPEKPSVSPEKGIELLRQQQERFKDISDSDEYGNWLKLTRLCMEKAFGKNHPNVEEFRNRSDIAYGEFRAQMDIIPHIIRNDPGFRPYLRDEEGRHQRRQAQLIQGYLEELQMEIDTRLTLVQTDPVAEKTTVAASKKVFIVHGHNGELKEATARLVSQLNLEPVILHERARQGRAIIENFSIHAKESSFAIVLLTADDVGSLGKVEQHAALQPRARQNVVFEMGFFFGLLGRGKVFAVYDVGVEMPSDLDGILYVPYDAPSGKWRWDVAKELQAAGYDVDLNKL